VRLAKVSISGEPVLVANATGVWRDLTAGYGLNDIGKALLFFHEQGRDAVDDCPARTESGFVWLPPVSEATRILCAGFNFHDHAKELDKKPADHPTFFTRYASSFVGAGQPLIRPSASTWLDWEGEIAIVMKRGGRAIPAASALEHIGGYLCFGDHSVRDFQLHGTQATAGKNFDGSGSMGPWIVTHDEVKDPTQLEVFTYLNGEQVQHGRLSDLIFDISTLVAYVSTFMTLRPGDIIATGTPSGIGGRREPPRWLTPDDEIVVEATGLGRLSNTIIDEQEPVQ
jgi:2-keto-4-pentenoate hydratase/2-oxohepta-3-ene-1,7-dioic acid hydratase in catechol pathway